MECGSVSRGPGILRAGHIIPEWEKTPGNKVRHSTAEFRGILSHCDILRRLEPRGPTSTHTEQRS